MEKKLVDYVRRWHDKKILVIGDLYADIFLDCHIARISREAPVLILEPTSEDIFLGGAANVVHNGSTLGGQMFAAGIVGADAYGQQLAQIFSEKNIDHNALVYSGQTHTITKQRVLAWDHAVARQHIVRIDRIPKKGFVTEDTNRLLKMVLSMIGGMDAVIISDYGNGTITDRAIREIIAACKFSRIPSFVDSRYSISKFTGVDYVKQNEAELAAAVGISDFEDLTETGKAGTVLLEQLGAKAVIITLGARGALLCEPFGVVNIPVRRQCEVFDVSGAGDTFTVCAALAVAAGAPLAAAVDIANAAAGVVVRKAGTAVVNGDELTKELL